MKRWNVHYDSIPHGACPDSEHCDCDCHICVDARMGLVISQTNRDEFIKHWGLPDRGLCSKDRLNLPEYSR
jgi:hypothetical protein